MGTIEVMHDVGARPSRSPSERLDRHERGRRVPVVVIVEDDRATLSLIGDVAHDAGWEPRGFTRLADVRAELDRFTPDLVILDDDLPDGRGGDLARELRRHARFRHVPVVVCTAAHPMRRQEIGGWAPVVTKPFDLDELERFLHRAAVGRHDGERRAAG